jgi:hypothetical protein
VVLVVVEVLVVLVLVVVVVVVACYRFSGTDEPNPLLNLF